MLIRLLCAHEMTKHVCKISLLNSKRLLRKLQKILWGYFILPQPVDARKIFTRRTTNADALIICLYVAALVVYRGPLYEYR